MYDGHWEIQEHHFFYCASKTQLEQSLTQKITPMPCNWERILSINQTCSIPVNLTARNFPVSPTGCMASYYIFKSCRRVQGCSLISSSPLSQTCKKTYTNLTYTGILQALDNSAIFFRKQHNLPFFHNYSARDCTGFGERQTMTRGRGFLYARRDVSTDPRSDKARERATWRELDIVKRVASLLGWRWRGEVRLQMHTRLSFSPVLPVPFDLEGKSVDSSMRNAMEFDVSVWENAIRRVFWNVHAVSKKGAETHANFIEGIWEGMRLHESILSKPRENR